MNSRRSILGLAAAAIVPTTTATPDITNTDTMTIDDYETTITNQTEEEFDDRIKTLCDLAISNGIPRELIVGRLLRQIERTTEMDEDWVDILERAPPEFAIPSRWWAHERLYDDLTGPYLPDIHNPPIEDEQLQVMLENYFDEWEEQIEENTDG